MSPPLEPRKPIAAVIVTAGTENGAPEVYRVGVGGVEAIKWGTTEGPHCLIQTVQVFTAADGMTHEFIFHRCLGVYYEPDGSGRPTRVFKCDHCQDGDKEPDDCATPFTCPRCGADCMPF